MGRVTTSADSETIGLCLWALKDWKNRKDAAA